MCELQDQIRHLGINLVGGEESQQTATDIRSLLNDIGAGDPAAMGKAALCQLRINLKQCIDKLYACVIGIWLGPLLTILADCFKAAHRPIGR